MNIIFHHLNFLTLVCSPNLFAFLYELKLRFP